MGNETFKKRQKEAARREKKQKKAARLTERRNERAKGGSDLDEENPLTSQSEMLQLDGGDPGPQ